MKQSYRIKKLCLSVITALFSFIAFVPQISVAISYDTLLETLILKEKENDRIPYIKVLEKLLSEILYKLETSSENGSTDENELKVTHAKIKIIKDLINQLPSVKTQIMQTMNNYSNESNIIANTTSGLFYTSSHYSSKFYYCSSDIARESLSPTYLETYTSEAELLHKYPNKSLHQNCY